MKRMILLINYAFAQVKTGEAVTGIDFKTVLNAPVTRVKLDALKGKVVLIDFWATWCGPCIDAMPHLQQLQKKYQGKLQVITVTDESPKRIKQFLKSLPSNLWFAIDTNRSLNKLFPHRTIPHAVLISGDGNLAAIVDPVLITDHIIDSLLNKKEIHLPEKKDNMLSGEEFVKTYFFAADTVKKRFIIQSEIKGGPNMSTTYPSTSVFNDRRITCVNLNLKVLYTIAYGNFPDTRFIDRTDKNDKEADYCLDLIVADKKDLFPTMQKELLKRFDLQAKTEPQIKDVDVLKINDPAKFRKITVNKSGQRTYGEGRGEIDEQAITMNDFANYLESFGAGKFPVVDETHSAEKFDIKFTFRPEDPQSLKQVLSDMGLSLEKDKRKVDFLVLYK